MFCTHHFIGDVVRRRQYKYTFIFVPVSSAHITIKTHPPVSPRATAVVACCRRACITRIEQHIAHSPQSIILRTGMYVSCCLLVLLLSSLIVLCRSSSRSFSQITPVLLIRTRHLQQAHITVQGNQLCASSSWTYKTASCIKSWASFFCPLNILLCFSLRGLCRQRQPPAERSPCTSTTYNVRAGPAKYLPGT